MSRPVSRKPVRTASRRPPVKLCANAVHECLCFNLRILTREVKSVYDNALRNTGLNSGQFALLLALRLTGPTAKQRLAGTLRVDRTALTRNLVPLLVRGFAAEAPGSDRRTRMVDLTSAGEKAIVQCLPAWRQAQAHAAHLLGKDRMRQLLDVVHDSLGQLQA